MTEKSILIFGAGKIGRSFIGQLFGQAGYHVVFADVDNKLIEELNRRKSYPVVIKGETEETILVHNVRAVAGFNAEAVKAEIAKTSLMALSVGKEALEKIIPLIAEGLLLRQELSPGNELDIIIAENIRSAGTFIRSKLELLLPEDYPLSNLVGLIETSIGKMVPLMTEEDLKDDPLLLFAEPYNTLILDKQSFKKEIPDVPGLSPKDHIQAWVDRKAFVHNLGHATAAYVGNFYHPEKQYVYEVLEFDNILEATRRTMIQAAEILVQFYPNDFILPDLVEHINDLLHRFQNRALKDTIFRVGQDLPRKLGINDRFAGIIKMAMQKKLDYSLIINAMAFGILFKKTDEFGNLAPKDDLFLKMTKKEGLEKTLVALCGFHPDYDSQLIGELKTRYLDLVEEAKILT